MRVCHLTSLHNPLDVRIFHKECISLSNAGFEVFLIAPGDKDFEKNGVKIRSIAPPTKSRIKRFFNSSKRLLKKAIEIDADIYHFHDPELIKCGLKLKRKGKIVIYDAHEDLPRQILSKHWIPSIFRKIISKYFERFENRAAKKFSGIVTSTPFIRDRFIKINPNTVDIKNYPEPVFIDVPYSERHNKAVYIGSITEVRGINELIKACEIGGFELDLAGEFSPEQLREEMSSRPGWKNINYLGLLKREEISSLLSKSKVGLVTLHPIINYLDSLPVKMFEYMAAGIPVVASDFPYWRKIIDKYECGICVNPLDPEKITEAVNMLLSDPKLSEKMGENGKKAVKSEFNWKNEEESLVNFYKKLIDN